jgi:hypothetical protein
MPRSLSKPRTFYILLIAGIVFISIGIASILYSNTPLDVPLYETLKPGRMDTLTPNMNIGNAANITITGSTFNVTIKDPNKEIIKSEHGISVFKDDFTAKKEGEYRVEIKNTGSSELTINGHAKTKVNSTIAFSGPMMLIITGIIVTGLSLRFKNY